MGIHQTQPTELLYCELHTPGHEAMLLVQIYLLPAFFLGVLVLGLPFNLLSLWIFSWRLKRWTCSTLFLFNLALADTSWLLLLPFLIQYHLDAVNWTLGWPLCTAVRLLYHSYFYLSIFFVTCVSVDRYLAIVHPLRAMALLGRRQACLLCAAIWGVTLVFSSPVAQMTELQRCPVTNHTICTLYVMLENPRESLPFSLCWSCVGFLLPLVAISYCCVRSVREVRRRCGLRNSRGRHLTGVLSAALVLFALLYLPYHLARNAAVTVRAVYPQDPGAWQPSNLAFYLEMCLCSLNSCVNPLFSCFVGHRFRREFWGALARLCHCASNPQSVESLQERGQEAEDRVPTAVGTCMPPTEDLACEDPATAGRSEQRAA